MMKYQQGLTFLDMETFKNELFQHYNTSRNSLNVLSLVYGITAEDYQFYKYLTYKTDGP